MATFSGGAWWAGGMPFASQAEAEAFEASGGGNNTDAFGTAPGGAVGTPTVRAPAGATGGGNQAGYEASLRAQAAATAGLNARGGSQGSAGGGYAGGLALNPTRGPGGYNLTQEEQAAANAQSNQRAQSRNAWDDFLDNPFTQGARALVDPTYAASRASRLLPDQVRSTLDQGFAIANAPIAGTLDALGAPDLVQGIADPLGYGRNAAMGPLSGGSLGMTGVLDLPRNIGNAATNIQNDGRNAGSVIQRGIQGAGNILNGIGNALGGGGGNFDPGGYYGGGTASVAPPNITPQSLAQQVQGYNFSAPTISTPGSGQVDAAYDRLMGSQMDLGNYNSDRGLTGSIIGDLRSTAYNDIANIQADGAQRNDSRAGLNSTIDQLRSQAGNVIKNIEADTGQRNQSRDQLYDAANQLRQQANMNVDDIYADRAARGEAVRSLIEIENQLKAAGNRDIGQIKTDTRGYNESRYRNNDVMDRLVALSERPEGPSAAEALMVNAQERAVRNAYGDAGSLSGGWRSQLTGQRRAMGQAVATQADIAAQLGALRAQESAQFRQDQQGALGLASQLGVNISAQDLQLAQGDAEIAAQIALANQANRRESYAAAGALNSTRMLDESQLAQTDANRNATIRMGNQNNSLQALLGNSQATQFALGSDTAFSTANADRNAQTQIANQQNALNSLLGAGTFGSNVLNSDTSFSVANAQIAAQVAQANQANRLQAQIAASNSAQSQAALAAQVANNQQVNSINAASNAGSLASATRGQNIGISTTNANNATQVGISNANNATNAAIAGANLAGSIYGNQVQIAIANQNDATRRAELANLAIQNPTSTQRLLSTIMQGINGYVAIRG